MRREGRDEDAVDEAGEVAAGGVEAVLGQDRHAGRTFAQGGEGGGDPPEAPLGLGIRPARRFGPGGRLKEDPVRVGGDALRKQRRQRVSRSPDRAEGGLRPARARAASGRASRNSRRRVRSRYRCHVSAGTVPAARARSAAETRARAAPGSWSSRAIGGQHAKGIREDGKRVGRTLEHCAGHRHTYLRP